MDTRTDPPSNGWIRRRSLLRWTAGTAAVAATAGALSACGNADGTDDATGATGRTSGDGGENVLRMAAAGSATPTLNVLTATGMSDYIAMHALYDALASLQGDEIRLQLAESVEPNADATEFTVRIHPDVVFHDGRSCTADDVRYSLVTLADPDQSPNFAQFYADLDTTNLEVVDRHTLLLRLHRPRADFLTASLATMSMVFPDGTSGAGWEDGIGSGPFRLVSAGGGTRRLERNPDYWDEPARLDTVELIDIDDADTRLNALRGGQVDYAHAVSPAGAAGVDDDPSITVARGGAANSTALTFAMNAAYEPFDNPDVRLAMKLLVDRQAMVDIVLHGNGVVGNDLIGQGLAGGNTEVPQRRRDVDRARALLESAGVSEVTLRVAELAPGLTDAARLLAEQAAEAGLTIVLDEAAADTYFADYEALLSTPFQAIAWVNRPAATYVAVFTGSVGGFNVTGTGGEEYDGRLEQLQATGDDVERAEHLDDLQAHLWEGGGDLVFAFAEQLDATAPGIDGITYTQSLPRLDRITLA